MRLLRLVLVVALGLAIAGTTSAQPGGFGRGGTGAGLAGRIAQNQDLQKELKMEKEQVDKLTAALAKVREDLRDDTAKLRDRNTTAEQRAEINKRVSEANAKAAADVLKPDQVKRLNQIENQQAGLTMYTKEDVIKSLKITDDQKTKIKSINDDLQKDIRELFQGGGAFSPETTKKRETLQKDAADNVQKVLTDDQKALVKDLTGEPFELRLGFGAGPGGAGGFGAGFGGGGTPGQILSTAVQTTLRLTDEQKKELEALQKDIDAKLAKMLTEEQKKQLKDLQERRPGFGGGTRPMRKKD